MTTLTNNTNQLQSELNNELNINDLNDSLVLVDSLAVNSDDQDAQLIILDMFNN